MQNADRRLRRAVLAAMLTMSVALTAGARGPATSRAEGSSSLRFFGTGPSDSDRVKIALGPLSGGQITSSRPVNVGGDFTIEFWMKAEAADNSAPACGTGNVGWYYGNILIDRDVFGGDVGDYGIAIRGGAITFGVNSGAGEQNLCGDTPVTDGGWHHVAVTRSASSGLMRIFVDGQLDAAEAGPTGPIAYPVGRATPAQYPNDPYLVLGAEKHDYPGSLYYGGLLDDLRVSNTVRYTASFNRPSSPHAADANSVALYRFDEGGGTSIVDSSGAGGGPSSGVLNPRAGGAAQHWSTDIPFSPGQNPSPSAGPSAGPSVSPSVSPSASPSATPARCGGLAALSPMATPAARQAIVTAQDRARVFLPLIACSET